MFQVGKLAATGVLSQGHVESERQLGLELLSHLPLVPRAFSTELAEGLQGPWMEGEPEERVTGGTWPGYAPWRGHLS